ncbi:Sugar transporter [Popillia japonica]|uniref:Sugar transporter n=1 Tax=Popillia japonica TaxID=7064 RepID=A0AAW1KR74_POPJA
MSLPVKLRSGLPNMTETVNQTVTRIGNKAYLFASVAIANLALLVTGMMLTWPSPILVKLEQSDESNPLENPITTTQSSWIGSLHLLGATFGAFPFGYLLGRIGRKYTLLLTAIPFNHFTIGWVYTVRPMYVAEIADNTIRGMLNTTGLAFTSVGMLFSLVLFTGLPETPYYLIEKNWGDEAYNALIRGNNDVEKEFKEIESVVQEYVQNKGTFLDIFKTRKTTKSFIIAVVLVMAAQLCGIDIVLSMTQSIFESTNLAGDQAIPPIIIVTSFITPAIVDRLGRNILLLISSVGVIISETCLGIYFYFQEKDYDLENLFWVPLTTLVIFILSYNTGLGPISWTITGEILPGNVRGVAASTVTACAHMSSFVIVFTYNPLSEYIGIGPAFWIYAGLTVLVMIFIAIWVYRNWSCFLDLCWVDCVGHDIYSDLGA